MFANFPLFSRETTSAGSRYVGNLDLNFIDFLSNFFPSQVSHISDNAYVGVFHTLELMAPLLQGPTINPHATLITLFMNIVEECQSDRGPLNNKDAGISAIRSTSSRIFQCLGSASLISPSRLMTYPYDPEIIKLPFVLDSVNTFDDVFDW